MENATRRWSVHPVVDGLAAYAWRLLVLAAVALGALWLIGRMWVVFVSLVLALFLTRALVVPFGWLQRRGWPRALAAAVSLLGFLVGLTVVVGLIGIAVSNEVGEIGPTVSRAVDDIETWLVEDSPFEIQRSDIQRFRVEAGESVGNALRSSGGQIASGAVVAVELALSIILGFILTFFYLKDGHRFVGWAHAWVPADRRDVTARMAGRAWRTLGGYLRGAAALGVIEGVIITITLFLVGASLAVPVGVITFMAAFVPFAGAIFAGVLAVLVALATAGGVAALVVAAVALAIQQLDNDLLAPVVYGRALEIHPVVILVGIVAGGALFGIAGSFFAVPVTAVAVNVAAEARASRPAER